MAKKLFYAVAIGREPGIYTNWPDAEKQVKGFSGARFQGFANYSEAEDFLNADIGSASTVSRKDSISLKTKSTPWRTDEPKSSNPAGIRHLYNGERPPWEFPTMIACHPDNLRIEAYRLLQEAEKNEIISE